MVDPKDTESKRELAVVGERWDEAVYWLTKEMLEEHHEEVMKHHKESLSLDFLVALLVLVEIVIAVFKH
jgi:hypothetical protein